MATRAERRRRQQEARRTAHLEGPPGKEECAPADPPPTEDAPMSEEAKKEQERLLRECYDKNTAVLNAAKDKASEQFDKTVSAIATAALGFSFAVFAKADQPSDRVAGLALLIMALFSASLFSSLLSFLASFHGIRNIQKRLNRWYHDRDETARPDLPPWQDTATVYLNWLSFLLLFVGVVTFVVGGYFSLKGREAVANDKPGTTKAVSLIEGAGTPALTIHTERKSNQPRTQPTEASRPVGSVPNPASGNVKK